MIYDRGYFSQSQKKSAGGVGGFFGGLVAVKFIIMANIAFFLLDILLRNFAGSDVMASYFALSLGHLAEGKIWTLLTYSLLHENFFHIAVNMLVVFLAGRLLEERAGAAKTAAVYLLSVLGGALLFLPANLIGTKSMLIGASAGAIGLLAAFLFMARKEQMTFLILFFPVNLNAMLMLKIMAAFEFFGLIFFELAPFASGGIGFSAHLGGICAGVLSSLFITGDAKNLEGIKLPKFSRNKKRGMGSASDYSFKIDLSSDEELSAEVDRILDKVSASGFHTLTDAEKDTLSRAKERLK